MPKTKIKIRKNNNIRVLNKPLIYTEKIRKQIIRQKEKNSKAQETETRYAINSISDYSGSIVHKGIAKIRQYGTRRVDTIKYDLKTVKQKQNNIIYNKKDIKRYIKSRQEAMHKNIKTKSNATSKPIVKIAYNTSYKNRVFRSNVIRTSNIPKIDTSKKIRKIKKSVISIGNTMKKSVVAVKSTIAFLIAGGFVAINIIMIICLVAFVLSSAFGIFFSNDTYINNESNISVSSAVSNIDRKINDIVEDLKNNIGHDTVELNSTFPEWSEILAIFSVYLTNGKDGTDVLTLNEGKIGKLEEICWNSIEDISYYTEEYMEQVLVSVDENGNNIYKTITLTRLNIDIIGRNVSEIVQIYNFSDRQISELNELLSGEYKEIWSGLINKQ